MSLPIVPSVSKVKLGKTGMPAPQASVMQNLAKMKFISFATKLPMDWKQPQGEAGEAVYESLQSDGAGRHATRAADVCASDCQQVPH
jgi:hypothetical protein